MGFLQGAELVGRHRRAPQWRAGPGPCRGVPRHRGAPQTCSMSIGWVVSAVSYFSATTVCDHKWDSQRKIPLNIIEQLIVPLSPNPLIMLSRWSPLGSANDFNDVVALEACRLATSPTFLQWTVLQTISSRPRCDRRSEEAGSDWRGHHRAGIGAYL